MGGLRGVPTLWPADAIVAAMRVWAETHGRPPTSAEWERGAVDRPCRRTVQETFGSFAAARDAAGLEFRRKNHAGDWTREQVVDAIVQWRYDHDGALPRRREWDCPPAGVPSAHRVEVLFGSWSGALLAAGYRPTHMRMSAAEARGRMGAVTRAMAA